MPEKNFTGTILVNNSSSTVVLSALTNTSINLLRTNTGGTDGTAYFNGKEYMTMKTIDPHLLKNYENTPLPSVKKDFVFDNIGWRGMTITLTVNGSSIGPELGVVDVTAKYDGSEVHYPFTGNTTGKIEIPPYVDWSLEFGNVPGFIGPAPVSGLGGREVTTSVTVTYVAESDLSLLSPLDGSIMSTRETANCYVIHNIGIYDIPLVYGCAISGDTFNQHCYYQEPQYSATTQPFYNSLGNTITQPVITDDTNISEFLGTVVLIDTEGLDIDNAGFVYLHKSIIVGGVPVNMPYLRFKCRTMPELGGNAIIAIMDTVSKEIVWSWHIWALPVNIGLNLHTSLGGTTFQSMDVNLGWTYLDNTLTEGFAPYYQWGRKDPMLKYDGVPQHGTDWIIDTHPAMGVSESIKHPNTFFANESWWVDADGNIQLFYNYWDYAKTSDIKTIGATNKTIYDPCPRGFAVPSSEYFNDFEVTGSMVFKNGYTWDDRFYQALGCMLYNSGRPVNVYTNGYYWTTWSRGIQNTALVFEFNDTKTTRTTGNNAFATQIVPVRAI